MKQNILYPSEVDCLQEQELLQYAEGSADAVLVRRVELHVSDCMLCSDVLEGLQTIDNQSFIEINENIKSKIKDKYAPAKTIAIGRYVSWLAAASVLFGIGFWFWKTPQNTENPVVLNEKKQDTISNIVQNKDKLQLENDAKLADVKIAPNRFSDFKNIQKNTSVPTSIDVATISDFNESKPNENPIVAAETTVQNIDNQVVTEKEYDKNTKVAEKEIPIAPPTAKVENYENATNYQQNNTNMPLPAPIQNSNIYSPKAKNIYKKPKAETEKVSPKFNPNSKQNIEFANQEERLLQQGIKHYVASEYKEALLSFDAVLKLFPKSEAAIFYKGATQCADNQCVEGINTLSLFVSSYPETSVFYSEAAWLTANCQLSLLQRETAKLLLQQLADYYNPRQNDAQKLLKSLGK